MFSAMAANAYMVGIWRGQINAGKRPVSVTLTLAQDSEQGKKAGKLEYGAPWDCTLDAEYSGSGQNANSKLYTLKYELISAPDPHCNTLNGGYIEVTAGTDGGLNFVASTQRDEIKDKATLLRQQ